MVSRTYLRDASVTLQSSRVCKCKCNCIVFMNLLFLPLIILATCWVFMSAHHTQIDSQRLHPYTHIHPYIHTYLQTYINTCHGTHAFLTLMFLRGAHGLYLLTLETFTRTNSRVSLRRHSGIYPNSSSCMTHTMHMTIQCQLKVIWLFTFWIRREQISSSFHK